MTGTNRLTGDQAVTSFRAEGRYVQRRERIGGFEP